jgi:hypothetical protein
MPFCGIPKNASGMIDPDDYQKPGDPVGWTCVRDPLSRWLSGVFNDYPRWEHRDPMLKDFNHPEDPFRLTQRLGQMNKDHLMAQFSCLNNDYDWEEIELWPITDFDRARQENGARWSRHMREDPMGEPWQISPGRWDQIQDFINRWNDPHRVLAEWHKVYDRDCRVWHRVRTHHNETGEPLVMTRREFQSRRSWEPITLYDHIDLTQIRESIAVPD